MKDNLIDRARFYGFDFSDGDGLADLAAEVEAEVEVVVAVDDEKGAQEAEMSALDAFTEFVSKNHWEDEARRRPPRESHRGPGQSAPPRSGSAPRTPPPNFVPQAAPGLRAVDPGAISHCLYTFTYLWLNNRQQFWFFPTFVGRKSVAGYRWSNNRWVFMGFDLRMVDSFFCSGR